MGLPQEAQSIRKGTSPDSVARYIRTGTATSPKLTVPGQVVLGITSSRRRGRLSASGA